ncbi:amino acid ABC transporter ATP-binding protein [Enterococcus florum]|uniref:Amino acid ABC transporter ATP-binding protein n=1 Tax=Enterococcus florum TaxID=2480627 RepID=A0A4P5P6J4_9ENTE|nr:YxeA family protein [Enterococcus florum]GCF93026.1 amino acid ABC transporter ATP-binding protein [Enterococcus florum]
MKKVMIEFVVVVVLAIAGLKIVDKIVMGGDSYYVQITMDGEKLQKKDDQGRAFVDYQYVLPGYDKEGTEKQLDFTSNKERPLRKEAFLKVTWNKNKGVTSYEEVSENQIPQSARQALKGAN